MTERPDPAALYPDVAAEGSLGAAPQSVAEKQGLALSVISSSILSAAVTSKAPGRTVLAVTAWAIKRGWPIRGCESWQNLALVDGRTEDLAEVAVAARAWHEGAGLVEIGTRARLCI